MGMEATSRLLEGMCGCRVGQSFFHLLSAQVTDATAGWSRDKVKAQKVESLIPTISPAAFLNVFIIFL